MASKGSDSSDLKKQEELEDITTCCICTEVYTDPKALPCIHTFCMKCLQETGLKTNKGPGDEMPCPICRRMFKIPTEGFRGLPKHFFIERLIQVSKVSDPSSVTKALCSLCLEDSKEQEGKEIPIAHIYCVVCKTNLCEECCNEHKKLKATKNHKLISLNEYESGQNVMTDLAPSVCELHEQKVLDVYCANCKTVVCAICFIEEHNNHKGSHVNKCVDGFRKQIQSNTEAMSGCISQAQMKKMELLSVKAEMQQRVESLECDVEKRKDEMKELTDKHASYLLDGLCSERQSRLKEIQMATDDIDAYLSNLESYNSYCQRITDKGSASDICRAVSDLSGRAVELQQQCQPIIEREIQEFKYCFRKSELEELLGEDYDNLIGEMGEEGDSKPRKRSKQSLLAEQINEIHLLRKEIEIERTEKESLRSANEQLRITVATEEQVNKTLTEKLSSVEANYNAHIARLKQELGNNKVENNALQTNNDKLKQELDAEKITNNSFQSRNDEEKANYVAHIEQLKQELEDNKRARNELQTNNDKLKQELDAGKTNNILLQTSNDKYVEELNMYKATVKPLETNAEKLRRELQDTKAELRYKSDAALVQTITTKVAEEEKKGICGMTILDKELFVVTESSSEVEVYDSMKLSFSRRWNLKELVNPRDIASSNRNKCLYIIDFKVTGQSKEILRVDPNEKLIKNWSTGDDFGYGLSVTDESNVILAIYNKNKLTEYSSDGQLIREIKLSADAGIRHPLHAIKLTSGHFVVSYGTSGDDLHRVCMVDVDGKLKRSFGGKRGSTIRQLSEPSYLSVDGNGFVMVSDRVNCRVWLLDSDLEFRREILSKEKHGLRNPTYSLLDESNGRLFVADNEYMNQRILIFEFK